VAKIVSLTDAVAEFVHDGDTVALEGFTHLIPFAAGHEIIRQRRRDLTLARMTPDLVYDQLIGAGCARKLIFSWGGNPGVGSLHRMRDAVAFICIAVVGATALSATIGVAALCASGLQAWSRYPEIWGEWWLGDALGSAHGAGIIHRDLKPANIMYDPATQTARLLDFGIARDSEDNAEQRLTRAGFFVGTLQYVAPEALSGELVGEQADVYSLATIAYHLLTGKLPFPGRTPRELFQQLLTQSPTPLNSAVEGVKFPPALEAVVTKGLERDLTKRWKTISDFAGAFVDAAAGGPGDDKKPGLFSRLFGR